MKKARKLFLRHVSLLLSIFVGLSVVLGSFSVPTALAYEKTRYVGGEILVKYKNNKINLQTVSGRARASSFVRSRSLEKREDLGGSNVSVLSITDATTVEQKIAELKNDPNVEYAQPNFQYYPVAITTNDTESGLEWALDNTGQTVKGVSGTPNADINAPEAWAISEATTSAPVIVAVIDTGVAYNHPDLALNMWDGTTCVDATGVLISGGCNHGYDYGEGDNTPLPTTSSHGTAVAGIIAAVKGNGLGIIGVAPQAKIMALKVDGPTGALSTSAIMTAISFAKANGAKIINASWGGNSYDQAMKDAIASFPGLFIAAAGNCGSADFLQNGCTSRNQTFYPAGYDLDTVISVAATDQNDALATFSNYDATSVDVGAPGVNIYSTVAGTGYEYWSGTSMAAPHVVGLAALIEAYNPNLTSAQVKNTILTTGDPVATLSGRTVSGERINAQKALQSIVVVTLNTVATVTSATYTVDASTITNVPFGTPKADFLAALATSTGATWVTTSIKDPVLSADTLVVTAEDGVTTKLYTVTVNAAPPITLSTIAVTTPATKLSYTVGDAEDITGLAVTGTYSDGTTQVETITDANVTGFDSSAPVTGQVLTVTVAAETVTYTVTIVAVVHVSSSGGGGGGGGGSITVIPPVIPIVPPVTPIPKPTPVIPVTPATPVEYRVLGAAVYNFANNLTLGSRGADVIALQQFLLDNKFYTGPVTGYFGQLTRTAVINFQKARGIAQVGNVDPLTRGELNKGIVLITPETPSGSGLTADQVNAILSVLESFGADASVLAQVRAALAK